MAILLLIAFLGKDSLFKKNDTERVSSEEQNIEVSQKSEKPQIISTKPNPLEGAIISTTEVIEVTFNKSLENAPELKHKLEPEVKYKIELSPDRKTFKIVPLEPYVLGTSFTLYIHPDTKFDGKETLGEEKMFKYKTINYRGI